MSDQAPEEKTNPIDEKIIVCSECKYTGTLGAYMTPKAIGKDIIEIGLKCPECGDWRHGYYTGERLRGLKAKLDQRTAALQQIADGNADTAPPKIANPNKKTIKAARKADPLHQAWAAYKKAKTRYSAEFDRFQIYMRATAKPNKE